MIDTHQHFWRYDPAEFGWLNGELACLRRDFLPQHLAETLAGTPTTGVISVQARQSLDETKWLLDLAEPDSLIRGVVGWVPLRSEAVGSILDDLRRHAAFKGVREFLQGAPDASHFDHDDFNRGIRELTRRRIPYDLLVVQDQLPSTVKFVDRHPNQVFILDHIGKPELKSNIPPEWAKEIHSLAERPNVYCKISGFVTEVRELTWNDGLLRPYFETVLEAFGPRRLMFGSDWPVLLARTGYRPWQNGVMQWLAPLSAPEREAISASTARQVYSLGP
jgi:L-fuconolactonase